VGHGATGIESLACHGDQEELLVHNLDAILAQIDALPESWHGAGSYSPNALRRIADHVGHSQITRSAETGTGKTTLLFSHLSDHHTVFTIDDSGSTGSLSAVRGSEVLHADSVEFVIGPTQQTVPHFQFENLLQLVLLDGPHAFPFPELEYYFFYPHIETGGFLIVDDIHIPMLHHLYRFLCEDPMFQLLSTIETTAVFVRTSAPTFNPIGDGWWQQPYNSTRFPVMDGPRAYLYYKLAHRFRSLVPWFPIQVRDRLRKLVS
jgi:hypothetical protein